MREVHLRCDDTVLAGCLSFLAANKVGIPGRSLDECVGLVLRAFVQSLQADGSIPILDEKDSEALLNGLFKPQKEEQSSSGAAAALKDILQKEPDVKEEIAHALDYHTPEGFPNISEVDTPEEEIDLENPPWKMENLLPWKVIVLEAPKDVFVEKAKEDDDLVLKRTLEIVYSCFKKEAWGTGACANAVQSTYLIVKKYKEAIKLDI
jgi:hypothetical protein